MSRALLRVGSMPLLGLDRLDKPVVDLETGDSPEMGFVVRHNRSVKLQSGRSDQNIRITDECAPLKKVSVNDGRAYNNAIRKRENGADAT